MKRIKSIVLFVFIFGAFGCEEIINLDVPEGERKLVVNGWITDLPGPTTVKLTFTADYFSNIPNPPVIGALVILNNSNGAPDTLVETPIGSGKYVTQNNGTVGNTYKLYIRTNDGNEYQSLKEELESVPVIDSIYFEFREETVFEEEGYYVQINTKEPAGLGNSYRWKFYVNSVFQNKPEDLFYADDEFVDGNDINGFDVHFNPIEIGDTAKVEQLSISRNAFNFFALVQEQTIFVGSIFDFPASPIKGNIYNLKDPNDTPLGFFGASSVSVSEIVIQ